MIPAELEIRHALGLRCALPVNVTLKELVAHLHMKKQLNGAALSQSNEGDARANQTPFLVGRRMLLCSLESATRRGGTDASNGAPNGQPEASQRPQKRTPIRFIGVTASLRCVIQFSFRPITDQVCNVITRL